MTDIFDRAQEADERFRKQALDLQKKTTTGEGSATCIDCGEPIPLARREKVPWTMRCIGCQEIFERET